MPKNAESLNNNLFNLLRSRGYNPTLLGTDGKEIPVPDEAEVFQFQFVKDDKDYGPVTISIDGLHKLIVYFGDSVAKSPSEEGHNEDTNWYSLLNHLKRFSQQHQLSFEVKNTDHLKYDMAKRNHMKKIDEGYYATGKKSSYSDAIPQVKIILQHSRQLEEGERRYRAIDRIFVENANGERFLLDTKKPGLARVYARHIAEGGTPYDEQGKHIHSLVEEYTKMAGFVRATRNSQFNESTQSLVNEGVNHYNNLREQLHKMSGHRGYNAYFEGWAPTLTEDEDTTDLSEMFASNELDPRIESVMPILRKLNKTISEMTETDELSSWADEVIDESLGLDEVSNELLGRYKKKAGHQASTADVGAAGAYSAGSSGKDLGDRLTKLGNKRFKGIVKATLKQFVNDKPKQVAESPKSDFRNTVEQQQYATIEKIRNGNLSDPVKEYLIAINDPTGAPFRLSYRSFPKGQEAREKVRQEIAQKYNIDPETLEHADRKRLSDYGRQTADILNKINVEEGDGLEALNAEGIPESLDPEQKRVGQLGPQDKVGKKGAVGKLVGACESVDELDERDDREDDEHGGGPTPWENPDKGWVPPKVKHVKEGQEGLDAIKRLLGK